LLICEPSFRFFFTLRSGGGSGKSEMMNGAMERLEPRRLFSVFYVNAAAGSDGNSGRSARAAWQTLAAVNQRKFHSGDVILLTGTFVGQTLSLGPAAKGVRVTTYLPVGSRGAVKVGVPNAAVFADVQADGIDITTSDISISDIAISADPAVVASGNYNYGVYLLNDTDKQLSHVTINQVSAAGFSYSGLCMQGWNSTAANSAGFSDVLIENSSFDDNQVSGIFVGAGNSTGNEFQPAFPANLYVNSNLIIDDCQANGNAGFNAALMGTPDGVNFNQGNFTAGGIFVSSVNNALVENCTAYDNAFASLGSVGCWAFDATRVDFLNDESYDNQTAGDGDGDGFDFDHGVTDSIMQRDYSHGNAGCAFLLDTFGGSAPDNGDTIRCCIGDDNDAGGIQITAVGGPILYCNVYSNTLLAPDTNGGNSIDIALTAINGEQEGVNVLNNIFLSAGSDPPVVISTTTADPNILFDGNDYWLAGAPGSFNISFDGTSYTSLPAWSAADYGVEARDGKTIGLVVNPMLVNPSFSDLPRSSADALLAVAPTSPLRLDGLNLATRPWAGSAPFKLDSPYNLAGGAWGGVGVLNFFGKPINRRAVGAG